MAGIEAFSATKFTQRGTASRHNQVYVLPHPQHLQHERAVRVLHELHRLGGTARRLDGVADDGGQHGVGVHGLLAAAQDARVARLKAEGSNVDGDVGAALVDDADNAQRHATPGDDKAVGAGVALELLPHGVGQCGDRSHTFSDAGDAPGVQQQPVHER